MCGGIASRDRSSHRKPSSMHKKAPFPLDMISIEVYYKNSMMHSIGKWAGNRHKTREPIHGREGGYPPQRHSSFRSASCRDAAAPAAVQGGRGQASARLRPAQCSASRFQHIEPPPTFWRGSPTVTYGHQRSPMVTHGNRKFIFAPLPQPNPMKPPAAIPGSTPHLTRSTPCRAGLSRRPVRHGFSEGGSEGAFTHRANVTAEFDIFFTISIHYFENTHLRPLPLNHLRKMPGETVKFHRARKKKAQEQGKR